VVTDNVNKGSILCGADAASGDANAASGGADAASGDANITSGDANITSGGVLGMAGAELSEALCVGNYYAAVDGLGDAAFAQAAPANWLSLYGYAPQYSGTGGDGSPGDPYLIADINDFLWFAKQVNTGATLASSPGMYYHVKLVTDIDLSGYPAFEGIGTDSYPRQEFRGVFDGDGHTIHVKLDGSTTGGQALGGNMAIFRRCSGATIMNLNVTGSVTGRSVAGVALVFDGGALENVHNYADITGTGGTAAGVINGSSPALMRNVTNHGAILGDSAAGLAMTIVGGTLIEDCANFGPVTGRMLAAGIVGSMLAGAKSADGNPSMIIRNTRNEGAVTSLAPAVLDNTAWYNNADPSTNHTAGGIVGKVDNVIVELNNVTNNGAVQGSGNNVGGILGTSTFGDYQDTDFRIINSTNNGDVVSTYNGDTDWYLSHINVGGIVGNTSGTFDPSSQWDPYGTPGHTQKAQVTGSTNNGNVVGPAGANVGAIVGLISASPVLENNFTTTPIDSGGRNPVGGTYYDPTTHEVVDGRIVERQPETPVPPPEPPPTPPVTPPVTPVEELPDEPDDGNEPGDPAAPDDPEPVNPGGTPDPGANQGDNGSGDTGSATAPTSNSPPPTQPAPTAPSGAPPTGSGVTPPTGSPWQPAEIPDASDAPLAAMPRYDSARTAPPDIQLEPEQKEEAADEPQLIASAEDAPEDERRPARTETASQPELGSVAPADITRETTQGSMAAAALGVAACISALGGGAFYFVRKRRPIKAQR
jgi:hypothetical protein